MRLNLYITAIFLVLVHTPVLRAQTPVYDYQVVETYPHNPRNYTQGLVFHNGYLYEGTGRRGQSRLQRYNMETGEQLKTVSLGDRYFGEGIEIVEDKIFQLTWQSHMVFVYDIESFELRENFYNPTEGWGLAFDGQELVLSDGSDKLYFIDPASFVTTREISVTMDGQPVRSLNELEYIDGEVWANIWQTDFIVRIDPATGVVNSLVNLSGLGDLTVRSGSDAVLNGIAYDDKTQRLIVTGKLWADLFVIELLGPR